MLNLNLDLTAIKCHLHILQVLLDDEQNQSCLRNVDTLHTTLSASAKSPGCTHGISRENSGLLNQTSIARMRSQIYALNHIK